MGHETVTALDDAIRCCCEFAEVLRKYKTYKSRAAEYEQLGKWLKELKRLRLECDGLRSNWYKSVERMKALQAERDAAISDLRKLVPAWKWDGANDQKPREEAPKCGRVEFG